jgi:N-acyl-D-aspartate/D-glutamate deacylase
MRDYKFRVLEAVEEALDLGRRTGVKVEISHLQVVGSKNWDKQDRVLELIENAARDGVEVGVDAYPYMAGSASITQLLPDWCLEGGIPAMLEHLESKATFDRIARETDDYMANTWSDIVVCHTAEGASSGLHGRSIQEIADGRGRPAVDTALHLLQEQKGIVWIISFNQSEENLRKVLTLARTSIITDGVVSSGLSHPRTFGTYPKFLGEYVRDKRWLSLEEAIVKTGARASRHFGLRGRGTLQVGNWADVVVFDPERIGTRSDYQKPDQDPEGIRLVLVNGRIAVRDGALTGVHAGQALRHEG